MEVDDGLAVADETAGHVSAGRHEHAELIHAGGDGEVLGGAVGGGEGDGAGSGGEDDDPKDVLAELEVVGLADGVGGVGVCGVRARPEIDLVLGHGGVLAGLVAGGEVGGHVEPSYG